MELKIAANEMLTILIDSGIDETDAKAIIFDIIQIQGVEAPERKKLIEVRREREKVKLQPAKTFKTKKYEEDDEEFEEVEASEPVPKARRPKRVSFSDFGGTPPPIK